MITVPKFLKTQAFLNKLHRFDIRDILERHGRMGVDALSKATPKDTGETASKWTYKIDGNNTHYRLTWCNSEMAGTAPVVILLQYGHATRSGSFVQGVDFINPALRPVYKSLVKEIGREVRVWVATK